MAVMGFGTANYLRRLSQVINTYPFMISAWQNRQSTTLNRTCVAVTLQADANAQRRGVIRTTAPAAQEATVSAFNNVAFVEIAATVAPPFQTWYHMSGCLVSTVRREARISGGNMAFESTTCDPTASDCVSIGSNLGNEVMDAASGIAEVSLWNLTGFTEANRGSLDAKLAAGENPLNITAESGQPWTGMLVAYWPLTTHTDLADASGNGHTLSTLGTLSTFASHPTIDPEGPGPQIARPSADASNADGWTTNTGGTTNLYQAINDPVAASSDSTYVRTVLTPTNDTYVAGPLVWDATFVDPGSSGDGTAVVAKWRYGKDLETGETSNLTVRLRHTSATGTIIATLATLTNIATFPVAGSYVLTAGEAATARANANALYAEFIGNP